MVILYPHPIIHPCQEQPVNAFLLQDDFPEVLLEFSFEPTQSTIISQERMILLQQGAPQLSGFLVSILFATHTSIMIKSV